MTSSHGNLGRHEAAPEVALSGRLRQHHGGCGEASWRGLRTAYMDGWPSSCVSAMGRWPMVTTSPMGRNTEKVI
eukprot:7513283-Alexandrium_andersonii.AAC.1